MSHKSGGLLPRRGARLAWLGLVAVVVAIAASPAGVAQTSAGMPVFEVDPMWPNLPNDWVLGVTSAVAVGRDDHVWILHRPRSVPEDLSSRSAPSVLEFDADGRFVTAWGGPGEGYEWPDNEHGLFIDHEGNVWITGNGERTTPMRRGDDMVIKFTNQGQFLMQIGRRSQSQGNADTRNLRRPADLFVVPDTNEVFVADGYGNRRVIAFDAGTGAFKRMWGAFGNEPEDVPDTPTGGRGAQAAEVELDTEGPGDSQFGNRVHAVEVSDDGLLYLADRANRRIQVFTPEGEYVTQVFINRAGPSSGSVAGLAFSPDRVSSSSTRPTTATPV